MKWLWWKLRWLRWFTVLLVITHILMKTALGADLCKPIVQLQEQTIERLIKEKVEAELNIEQCRKIGLKYLTKYVECEEKLREIKRGCHV